MRGKIRIMLSQEYMDTYSKNIKDLMMNINIITQTQK